MRARSLSGALAVAVSLVAVAPRPTHADAALPPPAASDALLRAGEFDPARAAPDFRLAGSDGTDVTLGRYRGKVVVLEFGFTNCAFVCPTTLAVLARAYRDLGADAGRVQIVYVTVDPVRDHASHLREYLARFDASFVGATGSEEELAAVRRSYGVQSRKTTDGSYVHSSSVYLIDRGGNLAALMPYGHTSDDYVHDLRLLIRR